VSRDLILVLRVVRCERRTSLTVNANCWHALPMGIHATLMLAPGCSPWRPKSEPTTSPDAVTDGGGGADMRRASNRRSGRFRRGGVLCSRPLVTGDSVATSHRAQPLPICSAGRITARSRRGVVAAGLVTLALAARDQRLRNRPSAALSWRLLRGREPGGTPKGNGTRATAEGDEPENAGRRETRGRRAKGENPAGKRETGESPRGKPEDVR
jgi:hypothetical protein